MEPTDVTADEIRRKAAEYDERGDPETAEILRSVADEMDADASLRPPGPPPASPAHPFHRAWPDPGVRGATAC